MDFVSFTSKPTVFSEHCLSQGLNAVKAPCAGNPAPRGAKFKRKRRPVGVQAKFSQCPPHYSRTVKGNEGGEKKDRLASANQIDPRVYDLSRLRARAAVHLYECQGKHDSPVEAGSHTGASRCKIAQNACDSASCDLAKVDPRARARMRLFDQLRDQGRWSCTLAHRHQIPRLRSNRPNRICGNCFFSRS